MHWNLPKGYHCNLLHGLYATFRENQYFVLETVALNIAICWLESRSCGKVLNSLLSTGPQSHSVVKLIVFLWFIDLDSHKKDLTEVLLFVLLHNTGCISKELMFCGHLKIFYSAVTQ